VDRPRDAGELGQSPERPIAGLQESLRQHRLLLAINNAIISNLTRESLFTPLPRPYLEPAVREGRFRSDLYYRLSVFPIRLPPLRERQGDIPLLVRYLAQKHATRLGKGIPRLPQATMDALQAYSWPGNVRELENVIERAMILSRGRELDLSWWPTTATGASGGEIGIRTLDETQREHILAALERTGWQVSGEGAAARALGVKPTTLEARMKKLGIRRRR
jgi:formate hydrogenlyase transcriptional activator